MSKFQSGASGNPAGRPKGSRNKLSEEFIPALASDFEANGPAVIAQVREEKPDQYLKVVASLVPRDFNVQVDSVAAAAEAMSDEELAGAIRMLHEAMREQGVTFDANGAPILPQTAH